MLSPKSAADLLVYGTSASEHLSQRRLLILAELYHQTTS